MSARFSILFCLFLLVGCTDNGPEASFTPPSFKSGPSITFDVAEIEMNEAYQSSHEPPYVEHLFLTSPSQALKKWKEDRLIANGDSRSLLVTIEDASITREMLEHGGGIANLFMIDHTEEYTANLVVSFAIMRELIDEPEATLKIEVNNTKQLSEDASVTDRDRLLQGMIIEIINDFNWQFEQHMQTYFGPYIIE